MMIWMCNSDGEGKKLMSNLIVRPPGKLPIENRAVDVWITYRCEVFVALRMLWIFAPCRLVNI
jgi:hypothetical protein